MLDWKVLATLSDEELAAHDIAAVNLACIAGLPDAVDIDIDLCLFKLDYWARSVRQFTERRLPLFRRKRYDFNNSEAYFRILCLITHLQRDFGVRYNPAKIDPAVPLDTADMFIHGVILGRGGTSASMPVVYTAVGRRLGYPLKLVETKTANSGHLFCRWDGPGKERFNIEATNQGLGVYSDESCRSGYYSASPEEEKCGCLLRSLTPKQELADFLGNQGWRWLDYGKYAPAVKAYAWASALYPESMVNQYRLAITMDKWAVQLNERKPPDFPPLVIHWPRCLSPATLPERIKQDMLGLELTEKLLDDPAHNLCWWEPMRRSLPVYRPLAVEVNYGTDGFEVRFRLPSHNVCRWDPMRRGLKVCRPLAVEMNCGIEGIEVGFRLP